MVAITKLPGQTVACICPCRTKFAIHASLPLPRVSRRCRSQSLTRVISGSQGGNARFPRMGSRSVVCSCHIADHELMMRWQKAVSRATGKFFLWKLFSSKDATGSSSLFPFNFYQWNTFVSLMFSFKKISIWNFRRTRRTSFLQDGWRRYFWHWLLFPSLLWFLFLFLELRCA